MTKKHYNISVYDIPFDEFMAQVGHMFTAHYDEVPNGTRKLELDVDEDLYHLLEQEGYLRCFVADVEDVAAGYMIVVASPLPHHKGHYATSTDSFYVMPEFRSMGVMRKLLSYAKDDFLKLGIKQFNVVVNTNFLGAEDMMKAMGMIELERTFSFELGEE